MHKLTTLLFSILTFSVFCQSEIKVEKSIPFKLKSHQDFRGFLNTTDQGVMPIVSDLRKKSKTLGIYLVNKDGMKFDTLKDVDLPKSTLGVIKPLELLFYDNQIILYSTIYNKQVIYLNTKKP